MAVFGFNLTLTVLVGVFPAQAGAFSTPGVLSQGLHRSIRPRANDARVNGQARVEKGSEAKEEQNRTTEKGSSRP